MCAQANTLETKGARAMGKNLQRRAASTPAGLALGLIVSTAVLGAVLTVTAKLVQSEIIPEEKIGYGILMALLAASFLGAMTSAMTIQRRRGLMCLLSGLLLWLALLSATALFFGGQFRSVGVTGFLIMGGVSAGALIQTREKKGSRRKRL